MIMIMLTYIYTLITLEIVWISYGFDVSEGNISIRMGWQFLTNKICWHTTNRGLAFVTEARNGKRKNQVINVYETFLNVLIGKDCTVAY